MPPCSARARVMGLVGRRGSRLAAKAGNRKPDIPRLMPTSRARSGLVVRSKPHHEKNQYAGNHDGPGVRGSYERKISSSSQPPPQHRSVHRCCTGPGTVASFHGPRASSSRLFIGKKHMCRYAKALLTFLATTTRESPVVMERDKYRYRQRLLTW